MRYVVVLAVWIFFFIVFPLFLISFVSWSVNPFEVLGNLRVFDRGFILFLWGFFITMTAPIFLFAIGK